MTSPWARERFDALLDTGRTPIGTFVGSTDPGITDILGAVGYDFVILDSEHSPQGPMELLQHVRAAESADLIPLVRVSALERAQIQKFLDIGAQGIVVPHVETAEQALDAVATVRFPPHGTRSMCPSVHAARYSLPGWRRFVGYTSQNVLVVPIIESQRAVDNLESILEVDGIDWVFFGPGDYSVSIGVGMDAPQVTTAWETVKDAAAAQRVKVMTTSNVPGLNPADPAAIVHMMDMILISEMFRSELANLRSMLTNVRG